MKKLIITCSTILDVFIYEQPMDLIKACQRNNTAEAMNLIMKTDIDLGIIDSNGRTSLLWACKHSMKEVALELIKTGKSNLGHIDKYGYTALTYACRAGMQEVALELIK